METDRAALVDRAMSARGFNGEVDLRDRGPFDVEADPVVDIGLELIGVGILTARSRARITQQQLAERCGLNQSTISRLEHGLLKGMRLRRLAQIVACLNGIPLDADHQLSGGPRRARAARVVSR